MSILSRLPQVFGIGRRKVVETRQRVILRGSFGNVEQGMTAQRTEGRIAKQNAETLFVQALPGFKVERIAFSHILPAAVLNRTIGGNNDVSYRVSEIPVADPSEQKGSNLQMMRPANTRIKILDRNRTAVSFVPFDAGRPVNIFELPWPRFSDRARNALQNVPTDNMDVTFFGKFGSKDFKRMPLSFNWLCAAVGSDASRASAAEMLLAEGFLAGDDFFALEQIRTIETAIAVQLNMQGTSATICLGVDDSKCDRVLRMHEVTVRQKTGAPDLPYFVEPKTYIDGTPSVYVSWGKTGLVDSGDQDGVLRVLSLPVDIDVQKSFSAVRMLVQTGRSPFTNAVAKRIVLEAR